MKNLDLKWILIVALAAIILVMRACPQKHTDTKPVETVKIDGKKYDVVKHTIDTVKVPYQVVVTKAGKDIRHDTTIYVPIPQSVDTEQIVRNYYSKNVISDSLYLPDSLGVVKLIDTIYNNDLLSRKWKANVWSVRVNDKLIVKERPKNQVYIGWTVGLDKKTLLNYTGPAILLKNKRDNMYSVGVGAVNDGGTVQLGIQAGIYWKIKLHK